MKMVIFEREGGTAKDTNYVIATWDGQTINRENYDKDMNEEDISVLIVLSLSHH